MSVIIKQVKSIGHFWNSGILLPLMLLDEKEVPLPLFVKLKDCLKSYLRVVSFRKIE